jgi:hypothetical protein
MATGLTAMATPRIGGRDLIARVTGAPPPRTAGAVAIRARELARSLAQLTHLVLIVGRRIQRADPRRSRLNAIHDQAITLYEELSRLAADVAEERLR